MSSGFMLNATKPAGPGQCQEIVPDGVRCLHPARPGGTLCYGHSCACGGCQSCDGRTPRGFGCSRPVNGPNALGRLVCAECRARSLAHRTMPTFRPINDRGSRSPDTCPQQHPEHVCPACKECTRCSWHAGGCAAATS